MIDLNGTPRYLFFTGKGGVGKTSLSCATGLALAGQGRRVLIVSTDPASNLDEVLETPLSGSPTAIKGVPGLAALNIDPEAAAAAYRERMVAPYRKILPAAAIQSMEEQFSGACTVEIAAFDEFAKLLGDAGATANFDHVIFDTAPTGHTLRLLTLPSAWSGYIDSNQGGASCLGPLAGLEKQKALYAATVDRLSDPAQTRVVLVARADSAALREAERTRHELSELGVGNLHLIVNGLFSARSDDAIAQAMDQRSSDALLAMPPGLAGLPRQIVPFLPRGTVGLDALRAIVDPAAVATPTRPADAAFAHGHDHAVAVAVALARRGHQVQLSTTDPAAHVAAAVGSEIPGLSVSRIDAAAEVAAYTEEVLSKARGTLDASALALLEEDLRSPCTEEIAVFRAFAREVDRGSDGFVVLDTAPTGHTILLLDAAEAYHREVLRTRGEMPEAVTQLLPRLRDPAFTHVLVVTLPEATPVHEAERLQGDLARAGIRPWAWVIEQSLLASGSHDPLLSLRGAYEIPFIRRVADTLAPRCALVPWLAVAPVGLSGLRQLEQ
ncbi:MAG: AAA family ATPase [Dechloromonas sp.]|nr:MAG: AAA family ATPase [Dechloromonas sp.]